MSAFYELAAKLGLSLLGLWINKSKNNKEMQQLYYNFLKAISIHSSVATNRALELEKLLKDKQLK